MTVSGSRFDENLVFLDGAILFGAGWRSWDQAGVGAGSGAQPYNLVGNPHLAEPKFSLGPASDQNFFFDPKAFAAPAAGTFGNVGRNIILGPNWETWDLTVVKKFRVREGRYFQIRADFFNFPNHPNWDYPVGDPNNVLFGRVTSKSLNRQVQITSSIRF